MLIPTSEYLAKKDKKKGKEKDKLHEFLNTIKVDFRKMSNYPANAKIMTQCRYCPGILTKNNREKPEFVDGKYHWYCCFCKKKNADEDIVFSSSAEKILLETNSTYPPNDSGKRDPAPSDPVPDRL